MEVKDINELKILKYITQTIGAQAIIDYITTGGSIDTLKELGLITKTVPAEVIEEEIGLVTGYTFTIVPTPADATVTINGEERSSITVDAGTTIEWSVSKEDYTSQSGVYVMGENDHEIDVTLDPHHDYSQDYLTLTFIENGNISLNRIGSSLYYSSDNGETWIGITKKVSDPISVSVDDKILLKGNLVVGSNDGGLISGNTKFNLSGNIFSIYDSEDFRTRTTFKNNTNNLKSIFYSSQVVDAANLILPATTLTTDCYSGMFFGCTSLTTAPSLPAITLAGFCYSSMFSNCTSLTTAPTLPATALAESCYSGMFSGCTSLTTAPELPATTLAAFCYTNMFYECTSLTTAPTLPATT